MNGAVAFSVTPTQGIAQGAPESPFIYAAVVEMLLEQAEDRLRKYRWPAGLRLSPEFNRDDVEHYKQQQSPFSDHTLCYINFVDDTSVFARSMRMFEYQTAVLQEVFGRAGQCLNDEKCQVLRGQEDNLPPPRLWTARELRFYRTIGHLPAVDERELIRRTEVFDHMTVLGAEISTDPLQKHALPKRLQAAWGTWHLVRAQVVDRAVPLAQRIQLLDRVVLPIVMWGLEIVWLQARQKQKIDALHRALVAKCVGILRRPADTTETFMRRRERLTSRATSRHARAPWSQLHTFRVLTFFGHLARQNPEVHIAAIVLRWRSSEWRAHIREHWALRTGGQPGRRSTVLSVPNHFDWFPRKAYDLFRRHPNVARARGLAQEMEVQPDVGWMHFAQAREALKLLARWTAFKAKPGQGRLMMTDSEM